MDLRAAHRYALALFEAGEQLDQIESISTDLDSISTTLKGSRELRALLASPVVKPDAKLRVLVEIFGKQLSKVTMSYITLLVRKGREGLLGATADEYFRLLEVKMGITRAEIQSAVELRKEDQDQITQKLSGMIGKPITPSFFVNPAIRGGFVARIGDTLIDASLRHQLEMLREEFRHGGSAVLN